MSPQIKSTESPRLVGYIKCNAGLWLLICAYILVRAMYWDCVPVWDGRRFYTSLLDAKLLPFDILNFSCDGHISEGFLWIMGLPLSFFGRSYQLFNIWLTLFGTLSIIAFYELLVFFTRSRLSQIELLLITGIFAFHPSILASMIHFNVDMGILTFGLFYWLMLLKEKWAVATIFGILFLLSKETGLALLPWPFLFCLLAHPSQQRLQWIRRAWMAVIVPYLAYGIFLLYKGWRIHVSGEPGSLLWMHYHDSNPLATIWNALQVDNFLITYLGMIFVMNFNWILVLLWVCLIITALLNRSEHVAPEVYKAVLFYGLFVCIVYVVTIFRPYSNVRYVMIAIPILLLAVSHLAAFLIQSRAMRTGVILVLFGLFAWEDWRTVDPLSKVFFGTFSFGRHEMLSVSKRANEIGGPIGRDQLVYNLQFLQFPRLVKKIVQDVHPTADSVLTSCTKSSFWLIVDDIQGDAKNQTFEPGTGKYRDVDTLLGLPKLPANVFYIEFPNFDDTRSLTEFKSNYQKRGRKLYDLNGYQMNVIHFQQVNKKRATTNGHE